MLQGHFGGVLNLVNAHLEQLAQGGRRHGAGGTDLCLAAALGAADRRIGGHDGAHQAGHGQGANDVVLGKSVLFLHILQHRRHHAAGAAGGGGDDEAAVGVLLTDGEGVGADQAVFAFLEGERVKYNETKDKEHWHNIIQLLPTSYNQLRTVTLNYEVLINIYYARKSHKLAEWHTLCDAIANLPYAKELILVKEG